MGADPSALSTKGIGAQSLHEGHPTLADQYAENLRIARRDARLEFLIPDIQQQIQTPTPHASMAKHAMPEKPTAAPVETDVSEVESAETTASVDSWKKKVNLKNLEESTDPRDRKRRINHADKEKEPACKARR